MSKRSRGITFCNPRENLQISRVAETQYVDNKHGIEVGAWTSNKEQFWNCLLICKKSHKFWEQLLYTTGGGLAFEKCFFFAMDWEMHNDKHVLKTKDTMNLTIQLTLDANYQTTSKFPQKDSSKGLRNLGARLAPDGNNNDENHQKTI